MTNAGKDDKVIFGLKQIFFLQNFKAKQVEPSFVFACFIIINLLLCWHVPICILILSSCNKTALDANYHSMSSMFIAISTKRGTNSAPVYDAFCGDPIFLCILKNFCSLNMLPLQSHLAEIIV